MQGLECVREFLIRDSEIPNIHMEFLVECLLFILMNNYFEFGDNIYHQRTGTAMGTNVAPTYANLFMGVFEGQYFLSNYPLSITIIGISILLRTSTKRRLSCLA